jgi:hypothetical protein
MRKRKFLVFDHENDLRFQTRRYVPHNHTIFFFIESRIYIGKLGVRIDTERSGRNMRWAHEKKENPRC